MLQAGADAARILLVDREAAARALAASFGEALVAQPAIAEARLGRAAIDSAAK